MPPTIMQAVSLEKRTKIYSKSYWVIKTEILKIFLHAPMRIPPCKQLLVELHISFLKIL